MEPSEPQFTEVHHPELGTVLVVGALPAECPTDRYLDLTAPPSEILAKVFASMSARMFAGKGKDGRYELKREIAGTINNKGQAKPSRNGLCGCGSGKKFKKCCGKPVPPAVRRPPMPKVPEPFWEDAAGNHRPYYDVFQQLHKIFNQTLEPKHAESIYAFIETGHIIPTSIRATTPADVLARYDAAVSRWQAMDERAQLDQHELWDDYAASPSLWPHHKVVVIDSQTVTVEEACPPAQAQSSSPPTTPTSVASEK